MNNFLLKGTIVIMTLVSTNIFASEMNTMFYWSNAKGLIKADNCKLETSKNPKLGFLKSATSSYISLEKNQGLSNLNISSGSLVKIGNTNPENGNKTVEVVGVNTAYTPLKPEGLRGDNGIISPENLVDISKFFIQINKNYMDVVGGTYWKVFTNDKFLKLNCPEFINNKDYFVFNVYPEDGGRMIARVAVSASETELFENIKTYEESEIYNKFSEAVTDESNSLREMDSLPEVNSTFVKSASSVGQIDVPVVYETKDANDYVSTQIGMDTIICTPQKSINVRNEDLTQVLFSVKHGHRVKVFQGWENNKVEGTVDGKTYEFIKVEFLNFEDNDQKTGYVVSSFVEAKSNCIYDSSYRDSLKPIDNSITGLDDKACCNFPLDQRPNQSFTSRTPSFGASRNSGERIHAAIDLYREIDEPVFSLAPGVVIRSLQPFYGGTYAIEVLHSGGFVARYGELTAKEVKNVSIGKQVKMGDRLGYIGKVNSGCCVPMLHFELYSGKLRGPLSQAGAKINGVLYARRRDLIDPTKYMLKWQNEKFKK